MNWSCAVALRDTDEEYNFMLKTLPAAFALGPSEILIGVDEPVSERVVARIEQLQAQHRYANVRIIPVSKSKDWNSQLAKVFWTLFNKSSNDAILLFDIDTVLTRNVLIGLNIIGKDKVALVSFTKRLKTSNLSELIRYVFSRIEVRRTGTAFTGIYWMHRPYYFETLSEETVRSIYNGIDTLYVTEVVKQGKYQFVSRKEIGAIALSQENADHEWRQFQDGMWLGANMEKVLVVHPSVRNRKYKGIYQKTKARLPSLYIYWMAFTKQRPLIIKGYKYAKNNPQADLVRMAASMSAEDWSYLGSKHFKDMSWKTKGTGFVE